MENIREGSVCKKGTILFALFMFLVLVPLSAQAKETDRHVTIYGLGSTVQDKISIPADLPQSYQIPAGGGGKATYRIISGESAKVSASGLVTPKYTYWKRYPNYSSTVPEGEAYDYYTMESGDTSIEVRTADGSYTVTVKVEDYTVTYGDAVMDAYIRENITQTMTDREIMEAVARFPASYEYSASYSGVYSMIIYGGGDCWASTSAITTLCAKMGIKAWARNGNKDPGAGSGHMNAMAELNGVYYELEAGYSMNKVDGYRPYDVKERDSLFSYYISSGSLVVYQYDGQETSGVLQVPQEIGGRKVEKIDKSAFGRKKFSEIKLPDTLTEIGDYAFSDCGELTRISIPASVTQIGKSVFASCDKLTDISVAEGNAAYKEEGQVIYSKDGRMLITCPVAGSVTIPSTVIEIADYAFYYNDNLKQIVIPQSVAEIGEGAFGNCGQLSKVSVEGEGLQRIGTHCFRSDDKLSVITVPDSVKSVGAFAFAYCNNLKHIYFQGDAPEIGDTIEGTFYDNAFQGCSLHAYYMEHNDTWTQQALENHGGTVTWQPWAGAKGISIEHAAVTLERNSFAYTGAYITPTVSVRINDITLKENKDYAIVYTDNKEVGDARVTVLGIGSYFGEISKTFTIGRAKQEVRAYVLEPEIRVKNTTEIYRVTVNGEYTRLSNCTLTSSNPSVATVDSKGVIRGIAAGTAEITVHVKGTENYLDGSAVITITVKRDSAQEGNGDDSPENNKPTDGGKKKYFDKKTGLTIVLDANGKKEAAIKAVDKKHAKGTIKIPNAIKVNGKSYKITSISKNAFKNHKQLKKVTLGKYIKTIGEGAFSGCGKLQAVTVGGNVTVIGDKAFYKCSGLLKITIPAKVKKIGKSAFYGCKKLKRITIKSKMLTGKNVGGKAFKGIHAKAAVKAPKSKLSAYKKMLRAKGIGAKVKVQG